MRDSSQEISAQVWQEWILEAIRKIRFQKQRPSIQRICQAIGSHHKFHEDIVAEKLEAAVESGAVVKVYNKGLHSYKAPMARRRVAVAKNSDLCKLVSKAVRELGECEGSSLKTIENYIQKSTNIELIANADFKQVVQKSVEVAVESGFLIQDGKLYKPGKSFTTPKKTKLKPSSSSSAAALNSTPKTDESFANDSIESVCAECYGSSSANQNGIPEPLSSCSICGLALHSTCANIASNCKTQIMLSTFVAKGSKWSCKKCKKCDACDETEKGPCLLGCCSCEKNFHLTCLNPVPDKKPKCPWRCNYCLEHHDNVMKRSSSRNAGSESTVRKKISRVREQNNKRLLDDSFDDPSTPVARKSSSPFIQKSTNSRRSRVPPMNLSEDSDDASIDKQNDTEDGKKLSVTKNQYTTVNTVKSTPSSSCQQKFVPNTSKKKNNNDNVDNNPSTSSVIVPSEKFTSDNQCNNLASTETPTKQLNQPDRISKEKQKFFRHSAFNSGRVAKSTSVLSTTTPTITTTATTSTTTPTTNRNSNSRASTPAVGKNKVGKEKNALNKNSLTEIRESEQSKTLSESSSSCSSSDNEDDENEEDDSSSSDSCSSSSSCSDSSESSSACSSSEDDAEEDDSGRSETKSELSILRKNQSINSKLPSNNQYLKDNPFQTFGVNVKDENWGFAAEAKKNVDIFSGKAKEEKVIMPAASATASSSSTAVASTSQRGGAGRTDKQNNATNNSITKTSKKPKNSQLKGLYDGLSHHFTTSDYARASIKNKEKLSNVENLTPTTKKEVLKETRSTYRDFEKQRLSEQQKRHDQDSKKTDSNIKKANYQATATTTTTSTQKNLRNNAQFATTTRNNLANNKKRIAPLSLPLERKSTKNKANYSSDDDDVPYLTQKNCNTITKI